MPLPDPYIPDAPTRRNFEALDLLVNKKVGWGSATVASVAALTIPGTATAVTVTGTTNITSITASAAGRIVVLIFADVLTVTDGSNLKLNGNFVTTADDTITLICDGTNWVEMTRSVN